MIRPIRRARGAVHKIVLGLLNAARLHPGRGRFGRRPIDLRRLAAGCRSNRARDEQYKGGNARHRRERGELCSISGVALGQALGGEQGPCD